jgi:hypothetical protein
MVMDVSFWNVTRATRDINIPMRLMNVGSDERKIRKKGTLIFDLGFFIVYFGTSEVPFE